MRQSLRDFFLGRMRRDVIWKSTASCFYFNIQRLKGLQGDGMFPAEEWKREKRLRRELSASYSKRQELSSRASLKCSKCWPYTFESPRSTIFTICLGFN